MTSKPSLTGGCCIGVLHRPVELAGLFGSNALGRKNAHFVEVAKLFDQVKGRKASLVYCVLRGMPRAGEEIGRDSVGF